MIFNKIQEKRSTNINDWKMVYSAENGYEITPFATNLKEITYFNCIKIISESIAKCTLQIKRENEKGEEIAKQHYLYDKLRLRPNPYMSAVDCYKTFVALSKHYGIAGLLINRDFKGKIEGLYPVQIDGITIDNAGLIKGNKNNKILYDYTATNNKMGSCFDKDIILLKGFSFDGINTKAIKEIVGENLDTSTKSQHYLNQLFDNGLTNKVVVQLTSDIKEKSELKKIQDKFSKIYSSNGRVFTVPAGYNVSALNLSLADAQYTELRRLSKEEIAGVFGVPLSKLGYMKENAKSEEQDNLKFYQDTLLIDFEAIEQEMDYKILTESERKQGYKIRFNTNVLLRTDAKTQADVINSYVRNGVYDLDKAREILGVEKLGGKPIITLPSGQVLLKDLLNGNVSYLNKNNNNAVEGGDKEDE
ncbi:phage portal protein [Clostridium novyi]